MPIFIYVPIFCIGETKHLLNANESNGNQFTWKSLCETDVNMYVVEFKVVLG